MLFPVCQCKRPETRKINPIRTLQPTESPTEGVREEIVAILMKLELHTEGISTWSWLHRL